MIKKKVMFFAITFVFFVLIGFFLILFSNNIDVNKVESVNVVLSKIRINNTFYNNINFTVNDITGIEDIIKLETKIKKSRSVTGFNLAPWTVTIEYILKNGSSIKREYSKSGNDDELFSIYLKYA